MAQEDEWPSARWKLLGCPFHDHEREDIDNIERELLEAKRKREDIANKLTSTCSAERDSSLDTDHETTHPGAHAIGAWLTSLNPNIIPNASIYEFDNQTSLFQSFDAEQVKGYDSNDETDKASSPDASVRVLKDSVEKTSRVSPHIHPSLTERNRETKTQIEVTVKRRSRVRFTRLESGTWSGSEIDQSAQTGQERRSGRVQFTASESDTDSSLEIDQRANTGPERRVRQKRGKEPEVGPSGISNTHSGASNTNASDTSVIPKRATTSQREREAQYNSTPALDSDLNPLKQSSETEDTSFWSQNSDTSISRRTVNDRDASLPEKDQTESEESSGQVSLWGLLKITLFRQLIAESGPLLQRIISLNKLPKTSKRKERNKAADVLRFSRDIFSESSCSDGASDTAFPAGIALKTNKKPKTVYARQLQTKKIQIEKFAGKRQPFLVKRPLNKPLETETIPSTPARVCPDQTNNASSFLKPGIMSSKEAMPGTSSSKTSAAKEKREREKEKRAKEKREKEKEKHEKKEKEKQDKKLKQQRDKDRKEKEEKQRREREDWQRRVHGVVTQATEPASSPEDSSDLSQHGFIWRFIHTIAHLLFVCLLLLTISSLGLGVSSMLAKSALEIAQYFQRGVTQASYIDLLVALVGFLFFLLILLLALLSSILLIPVLWLSLIEIIICPWSFISDYFLP